MYIIVLEEYKLVDKLLGVSKLSQPERSIFPHPGGERERERDPVVKLISVLNYQFPVKQRFTISVITCREARESRGFTLHTVNCAHPESLSSI